MKEWSTNHPKARLMERKRAAIVEAAREAFLRDGYGGVSMERIAGAADVSIMTLYRHAKSKDDLFAAVITSACHPAGQFDEATIPQWLDRPLEEVLTFAGVRIQERLSSQESTTLFRAVMAETAKFPHFARMAYDGLVGTHADTLVSFLACHKETAHLSDQQVRTCVGSFLDRLIGIDSFRVLLGLDGASDAERTRRAREAAVEFIAAIKVVG